MEIRIEAEALNRNTYLVEDFPEANARGISLLNASDVTGTASLSASQFNLSGIYDLEISYFDENDGDAQLQVLVNNDVVGDLLLNENTSSGLPTEDTRREYVIEDLFLEPSDTITIRGTADIDPRGSEWARVDFITFFEADSIIVGSSDNDIIIGGSGAPILLGIPAIPSF